MEKSKQIQIGILGLIAVLLLINALGGFSGLMGGGTDDAKANARTNNSAAVANNPAAMAAPGAATTPAVAEAPVGPTTTMEFAETAFDYGVINEGEKVSHVYKFTNTGSEPLVIKDAKGSCGCTVPQWPKTPIAPGATEEIKVEFNSKGKPGKQSKRVTITANTNPPQSFLTISGEVTPDPNAKKAAKPAAPAIVQ